MYVILNPDTLDDVFESVNNSFYSDRTAASDYGDETSGLVYTIGQTDNGTPYGVEENGYGQCVVYQFGSRVEQMQWYNAVTFDIITE